MILFSLAQDMGKMVSLPGTRLIQAVGRSSYEIYLTHMLVVLGMIPLIVELRPEASIPLWYGTLLALSVALGTFVRHVYSEPLNKALRQRPRLLAKS